MNNNWFSKYYSEIADLFVFDPNSFDPRKYNINLNKYSGELFLEIENKLKNNIIHNNKLEILEAVNQFVARKIQYRDRFVSSRRYK